MATVVAQAPGAAPITAAAGGVFNVIAGEPGAGAQLSLSAPGSNRLNGQSFKVRASGLISLGAGTYTATVQPLAHSSKTSGFTAAAANAIFSAAAVSVTNAAAAAKQVPWSIEILLEGDNTSGLLIGQSLGGLNNGAQQQYALTAIPNAPTAVDFSAEPPLQFAASVVLTNSPATSVVSLSQLQIES